MKIKNIKELKKDQYVYVVRDQCRVNGRANTAVERYQGELYALDQIGCERCLYLHNNNGSHYIYYNKNGDIDEPEYFIYTEKTERDLKILEILKIDLSEIISFLFKKTR